MGTVAAKMVGYDRCANVPAWSMDRKCAWCELGCRALTRMAEEL